MEKGFEFLEKELAQLFPPGQDEYKPRYVDKLVKVFTKEGEEEWILVHIEVQGYNDKHFGKRMFLYYCRIFDKFDKPITAFAIFTDTDHNYCPGKFTSSILGTSIHYTFNTYKILEQPESELLKSDNPFAMVVLTVKTALKGKYLAETELFDLKVELFKRLLSKNIPKDKIRSLMNFLRYYIRFESREMIDNFDKEVERITQKATTMGIEQFLLERAKKEGIALGKEEGIELGIEKGKKELIRNLVLKTTFNNEQIAEIAGVSVALIEEIRNDIGKA